VRRLVAFTTRVARRTRRSRKQGKTPSLPPPQAKGSVPAPHSRFLPARSLQGGLLSHRTTAQACLHLLQLLPSFLPSSHHPPSSRRLPTASTPPRWTCDRPPTISTAQTSVPPSSVSSLTFPTSNGLDANPSPPFPSLRRCLPPVPRTPFRSPPPSRPRASPRASPR
jgi:hypothetical protein